MMNKKKEGWLANISDIFSHQQCLKVKFWAKQSRKREECDEKKGKTKSEDLLL